jgi:hypothetical protein
VSYQSESWWWVAKGGGRLICQVNTVEIISLKLYPRVGCASLNRVVLWSANLSRARQTILWEQRDISDDETIPQAPHALHNVLPSRLHPSKTQIYQVINCNHQKACLLPISAVQIGSNRWREFSTILAARCLGRTLPRMITAADAMSVSDAYDPGTDLPAGSIHWFWLYTFSGPFLSRRWKIGLTETIQCVH